MAKAGTKSQGILCYIGTQAADASTDVYTQVRRVKSISEIGPEAAIIDATALEDDAKEKIKGIIDYGDIEFGGNRVYTDPGQAAMKAAAEDSSDEPYNFRIVVPGAGAAGANIRLQFKVIVGKFRVNPGQVDGIQEFAATTAVTGAVSETTV